MDPKFGSKANLDLCEEKVLKPKVGNSLAQGECLAT